MNTPTETKISVSQKVKTTLCKLFGHSLMYKNYSNHMKSDGDTTEFSESCESSRCQQHHYFYNVWKIEKQKMHL